MEPNLMPDYSNKLDIHFFRGDQDLLQGSPAADKTTLEVIQEKLQSLFDQKNLNFLLGSGTSCNAVPTMAGLYKEFKEVLKDNTQYTNRERNLIAGA